MAKQWTVFLNSVFFVLGFSIIFSLVGVLLQSVLSNVSFTVQKWLGYVGGTLIIFFGIYLLGLVKIPFLEQEHKLKVKRKFRYSYATSFVFGSAFAVGWTPCVGAILGAILTLAVTSPASAFPLMVSYSLGLGIPFLIVGLFTDRASGFINRAGPKLKYVNYFFGAVLIVLGIFVFTNQLSRIASVPFLANILISFESGAAAGSSTLGLGVSFFAGIASFLSPCILPLIPAFLSYLATTAVTKDETAE
jgi:cytochrome c-type biogenesis protein